MASTFYLPAAMAVDAGMQAVPEMPPDDVVLAGTSGGDCKRLLFV
jgi:hypothetical protein